MDRLVKTHLDRTDDFSLRIQCLEELVSTVGTAQVREYQCVDILALETREWILLIAEILVESVVHLHLTVNGKFWEFLLHFSNSLLYLDRRTYVVGTEVRVA